MILEEFDEKKQAVINPSDIFAVDPNFPSTIVSIFSFELFEPLVEALGGKQIMALHDVDGEHPVYEINYKNKRIGFFKARLGGPACVGNFEELIALGAKHIILLGNCGVLDNNIQDCGIIIPNKAIRDEGISYHYAKASDTIDVNLKYVDIFKDILNQYGYPYVEGTTWTTDAFYRETVNKIKARKAMGAICVEMECASMQALCNFRNVDFFQFLYAGDNLDHSSWQPRSLDGKTKLDEKQKIALLAFELANAIEKS